MARRKIKLISQGLKLYLRCVQNTADTGTKGKKEVCKQVKANAVNGWSIQKQLHGKEIVRAKQNGRLCRKISVTLVHVLDVLKI